MNYGKNIMEKKKISIYTIFINLKIQLYEFEKSEYNSERERKKAYQKTDTLTFLFLFINSTIITPLYLIIVYKMNRKLSIKIFKGGEKLNTYWESSVKEYFDNWRDQPCPLKNIEYYQSKKLIKTQPIKIQTQVNTNKITKGGKIKINMLNAKQIKEVIKQKGYTQKTIATEIGVNPSVISNFLNGRSSINKSKYYRLCDLLGIEY